MKKLFLFLLISLRLQAVELIFIGPCQEEFIMRTAVLEQFQSVGELTVETLKKFGIPFQGSAQGLQSIFNTPTGKAAWEIVSHQEMRAYGWCYWVDGKMPEAYPHEVSISPETKSIVWYFAHARYFQGEWVTQCIPTHTLKPRFLCEDSE